MKVILLKDIKKLGREGDVVEVKDGYARNYLLPLKCALIATSQNFARLEKIKKEHTREQERVLTRAQQLKEEIEKVSLTMVAEIKDNEEIYGSINDLQIVKALKTEGIELDQKEILIQEPIKKLGVYTVKVNLHKELQADLRVWVVKK